MEVGKHKDGKGADIDPNDHIPQEMRSVFENGEVRDTLRKWG